MATSTTIDLSQLPVPPVVEALDYETVLADLVTLAMDLVSFNPAREGDPIYKLLKALAYRELLQIQRVNEAAKAVMVAYATKGDLDQLGALFGVARLTITPADPATGTPAVKEEDDDYRRRIVLAPQGYSVAGPEGAYIYHALSASSDVLDASASAPQPDDIKAAVIALLQAHGVDASVISAMQAMLDAATWPGTVEVSVLSRTGDGSAPQATLDAVSAVLTSDTVRPLTDYVTVKSADIVPFAVDATLTFFSGPDRAVVLATAQDQLNAYLAASLLLGRDITRALIIKALTPEGVQNVILRSPPEDVAISDSQAGHCTGTTLVDGGVVE